MPTFPSTRHLAFQHAPFQALVSISASRLKVSP
jgi:hypothetical protein